MSDTEIPITPGSVTFVHQGKKDIKAVAIGFDWAAFFSPFILGIPHLLRQMWIIGGLLLVANTLGFIPMPNTSEGDKMVIAIIFLLMGLGFAIWLGKNGRSQHAKSLLSQGYEFAHPEDEQTKSTKLTWGIL